MPWVSRTRLTELRDELVKEREARIAADKTVAIVEQHRTWLAAQVNRLEGERALLLQRCIGVALPVPEVVPTKAVPSAPLQNVAGKPMADVVPGIDVGALMLGASAFEDIGDEAAAREGIPTTVAVQLSAR